MRIMNIGAWDVAKWFRGEYWDKPADAEWVANLAACHCADDVDIYPHVLEIADSLAFDGHESRWRGRRRSLAKVIEARLWCMSGQITTRYHSSATP